MSEWVDICHTDDFPDNGVTTTMLDDGREIAVFRVDGEYYAIEDLCSHEDEPLADGPVDGCEVTCPRHGARFCLKTGEALSPPAYEPVETFPVRIEDGIMLQVDVEPDT